MKQNVCIMWFRQDLRLHDNPALQYALSHTYILPIHILDPDNAGQWKLGQSSSWWLQKSLQSLSKSLKRHNHELHLFHGNTQTILNRVINILHNTYPELDISLAWNKCYEPYNISLDKNITTMSMNNDSSIQQDTEKNNVARCTYAREQSQNNPAVSITDETCMQTYVLSHESDLSHTHSASIPNFTTKTFNGNLLFEPDTIKTQQGNYFQIFTPFYKHCLAQKLADVVDSGKSLHCLGMKPADVVDSEKSLHVRQGSSVSLAFSKWFEPMENTSIDTHHTADHLSQLWQPGESAALTKFSQFLEKTLSNYKNSRNNLYEHAGTSLLSPHLHFGEISPKYIWHKCKALQNFQIDTVKEHPESESVKLSVISTHSATEHSDHIDSHSAATSSDISTSAHIYSHTATTANIEHIQCFMSEICWREFSTHLLYHLPHITTEPIKSAFKSFPWNTEYVYDTNQMIHTSHHHTHNNQQKQKHEHLSDIDTINFNSSRITLSANTYLEAWKNGQTGVPIVDAGMRELLQTGYMHNRARMICASFLTKNLLIAWQYGAEWFWDKLLDADLANNSCSWQWVAGCGVDAAPYFRIFNPVTQSEKFDPNGVYIRKWVPELKALSSTSIHQPWEAHTSELFSAGITLGKTYPFPIADLKSTRARALDAYKQCMKSEKE